jgi:Polyketide cyclase / dehydrase and lipid transport
MTVNPVDAGPKQISRSVEVNAPASELFAIVADPRRHRELDGSGLVRDNIRGPERLGPGARFSTKMAMYGLPYRITSTVTAFEPDQLIEWAHPFGHRWRWEFAAETPTKTRVTETFDYREAAPLTHWVRFYGVTGFAKRNGVAIENTLARLSERYSG